eukprot:4786526-Pyramimonas_sp.AAC.1
MVAIDHPAFGLGTADRQIEAGITPGARVGFTFCPQTIQRRLQHLRESVVGYREKRPQSMAARRPRPSWRQTSRRRPRRAHGRHYPRAGRPTTG